MPGTLNGAERYRGADVLKGLMILFVIVNHYDWTAAEKRRYLFPFWIGMAVPMFMIITGFVSAKSYERHGVASMGRALSPGAVHPRLSRYAVSHLAAFAVGELLFHIMGYPGHGAVATLTGYLRGGFGPGSYYYPALVQLTLFFPVIYFTVKKYRFKGLLACGGMNFLYELLHKVYGMGPEFYRLMVFRYILPVAFGCWLALTPRDGVRRAFPVISLGAALGIFYIIEVKYRYWVPPVTSDWRGTSMWAAMYIFPAAALTVPNRRFRFAPLELLGRASYHIFLAQMVYYNFAPGMYARVPSVWGRLAVNLAVSVAAGLAFYFAETGARGAVKRAKAKRGVPVS